MGTKNRVRDKGLIFNGQKSGLPIESTTIKDGAAITNLVLKEGQLEQVNGATIYAEILPDEPGGITFLSRFKNLTLAQRDDSLMVEDAEGSKTFTTLTTDLESSNKMFASFWRDRAFMVNQVEAKFLLNRANDVLSQQKFGEFGMDPPNIPFFSGAAFSSAGRADSYGQFDTSVVVGLGGSGHVEDGIANYILTFFDAQTNSESAGWGSLVSDNGINELFLDNTSSVINFGPKIVAVGLSGGPYYVIFEYATFSQYLLWQRTKYPRITHFSFYRSSSTVEPTSISDYKQIPMVNAGSSMDGQFIIDIDQFLADETNFVDDTKDSDLSVITLPENNYIAPTVSRFKRVVNYFQNTNVSGAHGPTAAITEAFDPASCAGFRHIRTFRDQIFGIGASFTGLNFSRDIRSYSVGTIPAAGLNAFSDLLHGSEVYQPDYFPYLWEVGRGDGQVSVGLGVLGDIALLIFKNRSTYYLSGSSPDNFVLRIMDTQKGCINESTIQETPAGVICLDRSGWVLFNKIGQGEKISKNIQDIVDSINTSVASTFYSWYDPKQLRYFCAVATGTATTPNITVCLDLDSGEWTTTQGTEGLSRIMDTNSLGEIVDLQGSATVGRISDFSDPTVSLFNNEPIESTWTSGAINFGDDQHKKKVQWLYLRAKSSGTWTVDIEIIPDFDESRKLVIEDWNVLASQSEWYSSDLATDGSLVWDDGNWAYDGLVRTTTKIPISGIAYIFQVRIINKNTDGARYGFTIESVSIEGTKLGR